MQHLIFSPIFQTPFKPSSISFSLRDSNTCVTKSGKPVYKAYFFPTYLEVSGANPGMKKCSLGNGTIFTFIFLKSAFNWPGNRMHVVIPAMAADIKWFMSP